jgi:hypothetical protein
LIIRACRSHARGASEKGRSQPVETPGVDPVDLVENYGAATGCLRMSVARRDATLQT